MISQENLDCVRKKYFSKNYRYYFLTYLTFFIHTCDKRKLFKNIFKLKNAQQNIIIKLNRSSSFEVRDLFDLYVLNEVFFEKCYDFIFQNLNQDTTFIDLGGYIGDTAIYASQFDKIKQIIIVEPAPYNLTLLKNNLKLNKLSNKRYELIEAAVSSTAGKMKIYEYLNKGMTGINNSTHALKAIPVKTIPLYEIINKTTSPNIILKCDIEGAESEIFLNTPTNFLNRLKKIVIEYHKDLQAQKKLINRLQQIGFKVTCSPHPVESSGLIYGQIL